MSANKPPVTHSAPTELLDDSSVGRYLLERGVISHPPRAVRQLGGGVSNVVLLVEAGTRRMVVKQALPRLRVAQNWPAKRERARTEAAALQIVAGLTPGAVPGVIDADAKRCVLTIEAAPVRWQPWKSALLAGRANAGVAGRLGALLGTWHRTTAGLAIPHDAEAFEQLRLDPYYRTAARHHPRLAPVILAAAEELANRQECLVHGDYSPKNVLVSRHGRRLWVIDFEVAHRGHPVFDVAFLLSHLVLKAIHRPAAAPAFHAAAERFLANYAAAGSTGAGQGSALSVHLGCLLLARVDGKSPVEYLDEVGADTTRALATTLLRAPLEEPMGNVAGFVTTVFERLAQAMTGKLREGAQ